MIEWAALAVWMTQAGDFSYTLGKGDVVLSGFSPVPNLSQDLEHNRFSFSGQGNPATIRFNSNGIVISAKSIAAKAQMSDRKVYYLTESHTRTQTAVVFDSAAAEAFTNKTAGPTASHDELHTDRTDYLGSESEGKLNLMTPFEFTSHGSGTQLVEKNKKPVRQSYVQDLVMHGSSGELNVDPRPGAGIHVVRDGHFEGPITFSGRRTETNLDDHSQTVFKVENGRCDRMLISTDALGEKLILQGNVSFDFIDESGPMHVSHGDTAVFRLDTSMAILGFDLAGPPTQIIVPIKGGPG